MPEETKELTDQQDPPAPHRRGARAGKVAIVVNLLGLSAALGFSYALSYREAVWALAMLLLSALFATVGVAIWRGARRRGVPLTGVARAVSIAGLLGFLPLLFIGVVFVYVVFALVTKLEGFH